MENRQAVVEKKDAIFTAKTFIEPPSPFFVPHFQSCYNYKDEINPKEGEIQLHAKSTNKANYERCVDGSRFYGINGHNGIRSCY